AYMLCRACVEVEIERDGIELRIEIDAMIGKAERGVEFQPGALPIREPVEQICRGRRLAERLEQVLHQPRLWTPYVLRPEFHHIGDSLENAQSFELAIQCQYWWTQAHAFSLSCCVLRAARHLGCHERWVMLRFINPIQSIELNVCRSHACKLVS